ncbi:MAG: hypothetical protein ACQESE_04325 [Nanobdellota archaeon]
MKMNLGKIGKLAMATVAGLMLSYNVNGQSQELAGKKEIQKETTLSADSVGFHTVMDRMADQYMLDEKNTDFLHEVAEQYRQDPYFAASADVDVDTTTTEPVSSSRLVIDNKKGNLFGEETTTNKTIITKTNSENQALAVSTIGANSWYAQNVNTDNELVQTAFTNAIPQYWLSNGSGNINIDSDKPAGPTESFNYGLGFGAKAFDGNVLPSITGKLRLYNGEKNDKDMNIYALASVNMGDAVVDQYDETVEQDMSFHEPSMFPGTYIGEKEITEHEGDMTVRNLGSIGLNIEKEFGNGFAAGVGPSVGLVNTSYDNQQSRETLETYVGNAPNEGAMQQTGFEKDDWQQATFKSGGTDMMGGANVSLRYQNLSLNLEALANKENKSFGASLIYNFGN